MVEYPYGRSGQAICYYNEKVRERSLREAAATGDNRATFDDGIVVLYEAPEEDDPVRGHFSVWHLIDEDGDTYEKARAITGDDGLCHTKYQEAVMRVKRPSPPS